MFQSDWFREVWLDCKEAKSGLGLLNSRLQRPLEEGTVKKKKKSERELPALFFTCLLAKKKTK